MSIKGNAIIHFTVTRKLDQIKNTKPLFDYITKANM